MLASEGYLYYSEVSVRHSFALSFCLFLSFPFCLSINIYSLASLSCCLNWHCNTFCWFTLPHQMIDVRRTTERLLKLLVWLFTIPCSPLVSIRGIYCILLLCIFHCSLSVQLSPLSLPIHYYYCHRRLRHYPPSSPPSPFSHSTRRVPRTS